ncbi:hypothetical protein IGI04_015116 [Brassica rapa subsp. trilocularis]|uniref:Secreted protein n=1 Tax=Brassica rapa subsp. trilocularis TaxID=1813537 RepID=A0ABQ7MP46_BRACM|nr:hypothetical protein IGI04_015116 [Brassica rapa subsp. trilocularis]
MCIRDLFVAARTASGGLFFVFSAVVVVSAVGGGEWPHSGSSPEFAFRSQISLETVRSGFVHVQVAHLQRVLLILLKRFVEYYLRNVLHEVGAILEFVY